MSTSAKANAVAAELLNDLSHRGFSVVASVHSDGTPLITLGTPAHSAQAAVIRVIDGPVQSALLNAVGGNQAFYGNPTTIQVVLESTATSGTPLLTGANALQLYGALCIRGSRVEIHTIANNGGASGNGTVQAADITAGTNLKGYFDGSMKWNVSAGA